MRPLSSTLSSLNIRSLALQFSTSFGLISDSIQSQSQPYSFSVKTNNNQWYHHHVLRYKTDLNYSNSNQNNNFDRTSTVSSYSSSGSFSSSSASGSTSTDDPYLGEVPAAVAPPKSRHQLRVDCLGSSKGLFFGLFFLTVSLLSLVLFFVFAPRPEFRRLGLFMADSAHCCLLIVSLFAMAIGTYRARELTFHPEHTEELGNMLLRVSAIGIFAYSAFSMLAGALTNNPSKPDEPPMLVLISVIEVF